METSFEEREARAGALDFDPHSIVVIADDSGESVLAGQPIDEGAKADALHRSAHAQSSPAMLRPEGDHFGRVGRRHTMFND